MKVCVQCVYVDNYKAVYQLITKVTQEVSVDCESVCRYTAWLLTSCGWW